MAGRSDGGDKRGVDGQVILRAGKEFLRIDSDVYQIFIWLIFENYFFDKLSID